MRPVLDFLSGMAAGLRRSSARSNASGRHGVRAAAREGRRDGNLPRVLGHFCVLALATACGAAAIMAATHSRKPHHAADSPGFTYSPAQPAPQELDELLATDPAVPPREWLYVVMHHSASTGGSAESFDQNHRERGWRCLAYHFVIGNGLGQGDGLIAAGPRWYSQEAGAHANSHDYNEHGIGICLVGNMDEQPPTPAQWAATRMLVAELCRRYNIPAARIVGHNDVRNGGSTACPGKLMPLAELRKENEE